MADSIAQQIRNVLEKNLEITNQELYTKFPKVRPNTIRHYKSGFFKKKAEKAVKNSSTSKKAKPEARASQKSIKQKITSGAQKAAEKFKKTDLEKRVAALEKKVDRLVDSLSGNSPAVPSKKSAPPAKTENIEPRIKELERSLMTFINEKRSKIKSDMSSLDELQQVMSKRLTQFVASLKNKG